MIMSVSRFLIACRVLYTILLSHQTHVWWLSILFISQKHNLKHTKWPLWHDRLFRQKASLEPRVYFHLIVWVLGCVTRQMPNPTASQRLGLKDPVAGQTGSQVCKCGRIKPNMQTWPTGARTKQRATISHFQESLPKGQVSAQTLFIVSCPALV